MLGHRLQRWPNIKPTLFQCVVLAGNVVFTWMHELVSGFGNTGRDANVLYTTVQSQNVVTANF